MENISVTALGGERLDVLVAREAGVSRSQAAKWIDEGWINGGAYRKAALCLPAGAPVTIAVPAPVEAKIEKENIPLKIIYQDEAVAVVFKPCGMVVHPAAGNESGTLVNALLYAMEDLSGIGGVKRPGIVHRLDKDTSGLLLVAKNDAAHLSLSAQLEARSMEKHYLAVVENCLREPSGRIDKPIARSPKDRKKMAVVPEGRAAVTEWTLLENLRSAALLNVHILTGRTHQIRVHMHSIGHPVAGDVLYGYAKGVSVSRLMLHAYSLTFHHPVTNERLTFTEPPPAEFMSSLYKLRIDRTAPLRFTIQENLSD